MTQYVKTKIETIEQPVTAWVFLGMLAFLACAYLYFVNGAVSYIVSAKDTQEMISQLSSSVGSLENEYLAAKSGIDMEYANSIGFSEARMNIAYVAKKPLISLSFNK